MSDFIIPDDDILDEDFFDTQDSFDEFEDEEEEGGDSDYNPDEWN